MRHISRNLHDCKLMFQEMRELYDITLQVIVSFKFYVMNFVDFMVRAVHWLVRLGFVPNLQSTRSKLVEKFRTRCRPRKAIGQVGSGSGGQRLALILTKIQRSNTELRFLKNKINRSTNPKRRSTNLKNISTNPKNKNNNRQQFHR